MKQIENFMLSRMFYKEFHTLFAMNVKAFQQYIDQCTFQTREMAQTQRLPIKSFEHGAILEASNSSLLTAEFLAKLPLTTNENETRKKCREKCLGINLCCCKKKNRIRMAGDEDGTES